MFMKSKLLAGAVAAAAAVLSSAGAFAADAKGSVNGDIRYGLDFSDSNAQTNGAGATAQDTDLRDNNSWAGVKASVTERGATAFVVYNVNLANDAAFVETTREGYIGLTSPLGTVTGGDQFTAYMTSAHAQDPFRNTSLASTSGGVAGSSSFGSYGQSVLTAEVFGGGLQPNQVAYASPTFAGVTINAAVFLDEETDGDGTGAGDEESHDYGGGVEFSMGGINAGVQALQINDEVGAGTFSGVNGLGDAMAVRLHGGFSHSRFGVGVSLERIDEQGTGVLDQDYYFVSGWFGVTERTRIAASAGMTNETGFEGTGVSVGVFQNCLENLTLWAGGSMHDRKADTINGGTGGSNDTIIVALGASYKFDLNFSTR